MVASVLRRSSAFNRADDANMGTATTQIICKCIFDIGFGRLLVLCQQVSRLHYHPVDAVTALCRLLVDKSLLQRMQLCPSGEPLKGDDFLLGFDCGEGRNTRADGNAIDVYRARAALTQSATKARTMQ